MGRLYIETANASLVMRCLLETEAADEGSGVSGVVSNRSERDAPVAVYVGQDGTARQ